MTSPSAHSHAAHHARVTEAFLAVRELPPEARQRALDALEDSVVRDDVASLLQHDVDAPLLAGQPRRPPSTGAPPPAVEGALLAERYDVQALAGEGGFGWVYRARDLVADAPVALKLFKPVPTGEDMRRVESAVRREASSLAALGRRTQHIAGFRWGGTLHDDAGVAYPYLVMDWLDGPTLGQWARARWPTGAGLTEVVALLGPIAQALACAHDVGVAHRDIKPSNILCTGDGDAPVLKLVDFGAAKRAAERARGFLSTEGAPGMVTIRYCAPEQLDASHGATGPWTDVHALALLLIELVGGAHPWSELDPVQTIQAIADPTRRPTLRSAGVACDDDVETLLGRALAVAPGERPASVGAFWTELSERVGVPWVAPQAVETPDVEEDAGWGEAEPVVAAPVLVAPRCGRYVLMNTAGVGAKGVVYSAYDPVLDRRVALKVLHGEGVAAQQTRLEAVAMARVSHPHVVKVYDVGDADGGAFIAMEFVDGDTLDVWSATEERATQARLRALLGAGRGLAAAHRSGVTHGDFKPANVLVRAGGDPVVIDFGLAHALAGPHGGTAAYMAPERLDGGGPSPESDQFSFAVAAWEMMLGAAPFPRGDRATLRDAIARGPQAPASSDASVPSAVVQVLGRALRADPEARFPSVDALLDALEAAASRPAPRGKKSVLVDLVFLAVVVGLAIRALIAGPPSTSAELLRIGWGVTAVGALVLAWRWRWFDTSDRRRRTRQVLIGMFVFKQASLLTGAAVGLSVLQLFAVDAAVMVSWVTVGVMHAQLWAGSPVPLALAVCATAVWPQQALALHNAGVGATLLTLLVVDSWRRRRGA